MVLRCPNSRCPNHEDTGDNNRFRGVQKLHPQTTEEAATGAERKKDGSEVYYCFACGQKATGTLNNTDSGEEESALLPAPPIRPLKSGDESPDRKES